MDAEALLDTRAKDLQALTFRLSPPATARRVIGACWEDPFAGEGRALTE